MVLKRVNDRLKDRKVVYELKKEQKLNRFKKRQEKWSEGKKD